MTNIQKVLLSAYKSKTGVTIGMIGMFKTITPLNAYPTVMRIKASGYLTKSLINNRRFIITEAGKEKLRSSRLIPKNCGQQIQCNPIKDKGER